MITLPLADILSAEEIDELLKAEQLTGSYAQHVRAVTGIHSYRVLAVVTDVPPSELPALGVLHGGLGVLFAVDETLKARSPQDEVPRHDPDPLPRRSGSSQAPTRFRCVRRAGLGNVRWVVRDMHDIGARHDSSATTGHESQASRVAALTGERNACRQHFGPVNLDVWRAVIGTKLAEDPTVAERESSGLNF